MTCKSCRNYRLKWILKEDVDWNVGVDTVDRKNMIMLHDQIKISSFSNRKKVIKAFFLKAFSVYFQYIWCRLMYFSVDNIERHKYFFWNLIKFCPKFGHIEVLYVNYSPIITKILHGASHVYGKWKYIHNSYVATH